MAATYQETVVHKQPSGILASSTGEIVATVTNDATTSARLDFKAFTFGTVKNSSGASDTITWYAANHLTGAAYVLKDQDGAAVSQVVGNNEIHELHSALAGCAIIIPVGSVASAALNFIFKR